MAKHFARQAPDTTAVFLRALDESRAQQRRPARPGRPSHLAPEHYASFDELAVEDALEGVRRSAAGEGAADADSTDELEALAGEPDLLIEAPGEALPTASFRDAEPNALGASGAGEGPNALGSSGAGEGPNALRAFGSEVPEAPRSSGTSEGPSRDIEASVGRSSALMSVLVLISRLTGFLRTWGQAYALGVTVVASCYTVANNLPNQLYELVVGGMLVTAFLPVYMSVKRNGGREAANRYTSNLVSLVTILMGVVALLGIVFAAQVVLTQSVGAQEAFDSGLAAMLFRFFAIEVVLYALSSIFSGVLNAERDYLWSMAAPIFNNFICMASFFGYAFLLDKDPAIAILVLAIGNPAGVLVQVLMLVPSLRRHGIRIRPYVDLHDPALKETLSIGIPSIVVMVCSFVTVSVQSSCALSATASGAAVIYYARLWFTLPYAILAVPVTTAMFTELSEFFSAGDMAGFKGGVASGTGRILFFLVPFGLFLVAFSPELVSLLNSGNFTADETAMTAQYLCMLALGLPFYGVCMYLQKVCSASRAMGFYAIANVIGSVLQVAFCVALTPVWGLNMVGLSSSVFFAAVDVVTFVWLRRRVGALGMGRVLGSAARSLALGLVGAAVGAAIVWAAGAVAGLHATGLASGVMLCVVGGIPALLVTYGAAVALKLPEARFLQSMVGRLGGKAA